MMFWVLLVLYCLVFLLVLCAFGVRVHDGMGVKISTATAGDPHMVVPCAQRLVNLNEKGFYNSDGQIIEYDEYRKFSVAGWSMLLAGIQDGDLLFVKPYGSEVDMKFPCVVVIEREHFSRFDRNTAHYKVRRSWAVCHMGKSDLDQVLDQIISSAEFQQLINESGGKNCFMSPEVMKSDFFDTRLKKYLMDYPLCKQTDDENNVAVISTTLDTKRNVVHFSIHPYRCIVGEVIYSFGLQEAA